jgi:hypothetical protein
MIKFITSYTALVTSNVLIASVVVTSNVLMMHRYVRTEGMIDDV